jgi:cell division protein FtsZ
MEVLMPEDLSKILQTIRRDAGFDAGIQTEPLIQMETGDITDHSPLIESAGEAFGRPISVCFAGVGTCGVNILMSLKAQNVQSEMVDFVGINSDGGSIKELEKNGFRNNIALGSDSYFLGAGGDVETAKEQGERHFDEFKKRFKNVDLALIVTGMGGGTGTGAAPWVAKAAKETQNGKRNSLTVGVTTMPNLIEADRFEIAEQGIAEFRKYVDALIVIDQMNILDVLEDETASADQAYDLVDMRFQTVLQSIMDTVTKYTKRNIDFADVCSTLKNSGEAIITTVEANSESTEDIKKALSCAINDKLLLDHSDKIASRLLVYHFYEKGYSERKHFEVVSEVQKLFGWTRKEKGHSVAHYSCVLDNPPEGTVKFLKIGNDSGDEYKGKTKVIVMAGGFVDKAGIETVPPTRIMPAVVVPPPPQPAPAPVPAPQPVFQPAPQTQIQPAQITQPQPEQTAQPNAATDSFSINKLLSDGFSL